MSNFLGANVLNCCLTEDGRTFGYSGENEDLIGSTVECSKVVHTYKEKIMMFNIEGRPYVVANEIGTNLYRIE